MGIEAYVYAGLFIASIIYALILEWWSRVDPDGFDDNTWLAVVVGVGYVLAGLRLIVQPETWLSLVWAFILAGIPIVLRSLYNNARKNRHFQGIIARLRGDQ